MPGIEVESLTRRAAALRDFSEFLGRQAHILARFPDLVFQQAANEPDRSRLRGTALHRADRGRAPRAWVRLRNRAPAEPCRFTLEAGPGVGCAVAGDGRRLLFGEESRVRIRELWGARDALVLDRFAAGVTACSASSDLRWVVVATADHRLSFWDGISGALHHDAQLPAPATACALSPQGFLAAVGLANGELGFSPLRAGARPFTLPAHAGRITFCRWSPDGERLVTGSVDGTLRLWRDLESVRIAGELGGLADCAFSPDGSRFVTVGPPDPRLRVRDSRSGSPLAEALVPASAADSAHTPGGEGGVAAVAYSPDGSRLALGCWDCTVRIWSAEPVAEIRCLRGHAEPVVACVFLPDGRSLVTRDRGGTIKCFDLAAVEAGDERARHGGMVTDLWLSPDGSRLATLSWDRTCKTWEVGSARCLGSEARGVGAGPPAGSWSAPRDAIRASAFDRREVRSPDGRCRAAIAAAGRRLELLDPRTDRVVRTLERRPAGESLVGLTALLGVTACAVSPDGELLASLSDRRLLTVWSAEGELRARFPTSGVGTVVAFTAARDLVVGDSTGSVDFLRLEEREVIGAPAGP